MQKNPLTSLLEDDNSSFDDIVRLARTNYNVNTTNSKGDTILHLLATKKKLIRHLDGDHLFKTLKELVARGADLNALNQAQKTPFQLLLDDLERTKVSSEGTFMRYVTLIKLGANPATKSSNGQTLLHLMIARNQYEYYNIFAGGIHPLDDPINLFVRQHRAIVEAVNGRNQTPLRYLLDSNTYDADFTHNARLLVSLGANLGTRGANGQTFMDIIVIQLQDNCEAASKATFYEILDLVQRNPNIANSEGETILHLLVAERASPRPSEGDSSHTTNFFCENIKVNAINVDVIKTLVVAGANLNIRNQQQQTPFQLLLDRLEQGEVTENDMMDFVQLGADPNAKSAEDKTLLHMLIARNYPTDVFYVYPLDSHIKRLVKEHHANVEVKNGDDQTSLRCLLDGDTHDENFVHNAMLLITLGAHPGTKSANRQTLLELLEANDMNAIHNAAIKTLVEKYPAEILGGNYQYKKKIIAPLEAYAKPNKLSYFTRQHVASANEIINLIMAEKDFTYIGQLLQSQIQLLEQSFKMVSGQDSSSNLDENFIPNDQLKEKVRKHGRLEESGYYKALKDTFNLYIATDPQNANTDDAVGLPHNDQGDRSIIANPFF